MKSELITVCGPFTKDAAMQTAEYLGIKNHSIYSTDEGYFVERHANIIPDVIFGYKFSDILDMQQRNK